MTQLRDRNLEGFDNLVVGIDRALRTLTGEAQANRENPAGELVDAEMSDDERRHVTGLMRVNHTGEVCAQALYEGQALTARTDASRKALLDAAEEEQDHLVWCRKRLEELDGRTSILDPLFFGASFVMGAVTGLVGDRISMGFVEATEDQVVAHLDRHLEDLPEGDHRSRAILEQMREDEKRHGDQAMDMGATQFPPPVKAAMTVVSRLMTETTYKI